MRDETKYAKWRNYHHSSEQLYKHVTLHAAQVSTYYVELNSISLKLNKLKIASGVERRVNKEYYNNNLKDPD
jgi:hypothetical protein